MPETTAHPADAVLTAGLCWLYETEQPADAHAQHHGEMLAADGNRTYSFVPVGARKLPVVVVDVARVEWIDNGPNELKTPANPLEPGELEALAAELERRGFPVDGTWNGHPGITGSVGLRRPAHPSQVAAVERYHRGCQDHPARSVFCDCEVWRAGFRRTHPTPAP
ncbi:hypothetical protein [Streptomyces sp. NPDC059165]|uniref:hypothetical protein n=1 Tax=Streptomyces sp. NPDC059165 TaxID=3346751 RepID=UPI0036B825A5